MRLHDLHTTAAEAVAPYFPIEEPEATRRRLSEQEETLRKNVRGILRSAAREGMEIETKTIPPNLSTEGIGVVKKMLAIEFEATESFQLFAGNDPDDLGRELFVTQTIVFGTHDLLVHGGVTRPVRSLDILTGFMVRDWATKDIIDNHPLNDTAVLERLSPRYPVFTNNERFMTGGIANQLYPPLLSVTDEMEYAAANRFRGGEGWSEVLEGMLCAVDQASAVITGKSTLSLL